MPSEFSSNIREIAAEIKLYEKATATAIRKAARIAVTKAAAGTLEAIKESASWSTGGTSTDKNPHTSIPAATTMKLSFSVRSGGAKIATNAKKAPHGRPLERGSQGSGGAYDRHPVFGSSTFGPLRQGQHRSKGFYNQPTRPFFYDTAKRRERLNEAELIAAVDEAIRAVGWRGI